MFKKKEELMQKWQTYAVLEGLSKTLSAVVQDVVGKTMATLEMGCIAAIGIGSVQAASGFLGFFVKTRGRMRLLAFFPNAAVIWAILFGFSAGIFGTVISLYTFTLGAEFSARTLLLSASIVPGAIAGRLMWGAKTDPLGVRQFLGIGLFLIACWAILNFPDTLEFAPWVWWTLVITLSQAWNEIFSRKAADAKLDPWVNNFWVGVSTIVATSLALVVLIEFGSVLPSALTPPFVVGVVAIGFIVSGMIAFKLLSYQGGGTIALKKLIMQSVYLSSFTIVGLAYGQAFTVGTLIGLVLFLPAFSLIDKDTWRGVQSLFARVARA